MSGHLSFICGLTRHPRPGDRAFKTVVTPEQLSIPGDKARRSENSQLALVPDASSAFIPATAEPGGPPPLTHVLLSTMLPPVIKDPHSAIAAGQ
jgi:hypothetical protein